jgi:uncharacterized protein
VLRDSACEGWVLHRRLSPIRHEFRYPLCMLCVDVDRLEDHHSTWFSSSRRPAPVALRPADYPSGQRAARSPGAVRGGVRSAVNARLQQDGIESAQQVFLLTQPRSWGVLFNPVSFYFCLRDGELVAVLAEITNTPWDEVHTYVLDARGQGSELTFEFPKRFHVSPFMPMDLRYRWRVRLAPQAIEVAMTLLRDGEEMFFAGMYLRLRPLDQRAMRRVALRFPLQSVRTLARIYWQAFRLWRRGTPFYTHPGPFQEREST